MAAKQATHNSEHWLGQLGQLHALLVAAGFTVAPSRWLNATDLLSQLIAEGELPQSSLSLSRMLSPLFCQSNAEQEDFSNIVQQWWRQVHNEGPENTEASSEAKSSLPSQTPT
jgi:hypothetical protein